MTSAQLIKILEATLVTVELTLVSIAIGIVLAFAIAFMRMAKNKVAKTIGWLYIWIFRGTPLLLQIMVVYFAIPIMFRNWFGVQFFFFPCLRWSNRVDFKHRSIYRRNYSRRHRIN